MKLPECFNENQMEKTWQAFRKEYEIDVDAFRYAQSEFKDANKVLDKKIEYLKNTDNFINVRHIATFSALEVLENIQNLKQK